MATKIDPTTVQTISWETDVCDRCGGTGYMPYAAYGGVCFKCNKAGKVLTPAGRAARKAYMEARNAACVKATVRELVAGDKFSLNGDRWARVLEVKAPEGDVWYGKAGDVSLWSIETKNTNYLMDPDAEVLIWSPNAFLAGVTKVVNRKGSVLTFKTAE